VKNTRKGFTLIEVVIAAAISTIIIFGAFAILRVSNRHLQIMHAKMSLQEGPREALFKMAQEIRQTPQKVGANRILITEDGILNVGADESGIEKANMITFSVPDASTLTVDGAYEPVWVYDVKYKLDEKTHQILRIAKNMNTLVEKQTVLANEVTALEFSRKATTPGLITITVAAQRELPNGERIPEEPIQMTAQAEARNP